MAYTQAAGGIAVSIRWMVAFATAESDMTWQEGVAFGNAIGLRELACLCDDLIGLHEVSLLGGRSVMGELRCTHDPTLV